MDEKMLLEQIGAMFEEHSDKLAKQIRREVTTDLKAMIELDVTKRIDALFDGYKLTHEKQYELERRVEKLERIVEAIQNNPQQQNH